MIDFEKIKPLNVLFVGDAIIDEYVYVRPIGKSIKENVISTRYESREEFIGGVGAAAAHVDGLCEQVDVMHGAKVTRNLRYVDSVTMQKLFTLHEAETALVGQVYDFARYDAVVVTDFGHGEMTKELIRSITEQAQCIAINAQTNSQNYGFNLITKYPRADYVVVDELEARLAVHDRDSPIQEVIPKLGFKRGVVTLGANGAVGFDEFGLHWCDPLTAHPVDTIGAGDAFLAVSSLFAAIGAPMHEIVRIGNAAGAAKCGIVGHRRAVTRADMEALLA